MGLEVPELESGIRNEDWRFFYLLKIEKIAFKQKISKILF